MNTVLCLGGYGQFGLPTARYLMDDPSIDRVIIAGRSLAKAQAVADQLGPTCQAREVDADDPESLANGVRGVDLVLSTLWSAEGRAERVPRAAIEAGAHYIDLNGDANDPEVDRLAREKGLAVLTGVGMSPGVLNLLSRHLLASIEDPSVLITVRHWPLLLDVWVDLFDAYIELPGGRTRGALGRQLFPALTAVPQDPKHAAEVLRDACVVPFWVTLAGAPDRWTAVPTLVDGAIVDVDVMHDGLNLPLTSGGFRNERILAATGPSAGDDGVQRYSATVTGLQPSFDEGVRAAARRIADGADAAAEIEALEDRVTSDVESVLRPPDEVAQLPAGMFLAYGHDAGRPVTASLFVNDALFTAERFLSLTAAAIAVTVRYVLRGDAPFVGASNMPAAVTNLDRFETDYMALVPGLPEGTRLFTMHVDDASDPAQRA